MRTCIYSLPVCELRVQGAGAFQLREGLRALGRGGETVAFAYGHIQPIDPFQEILGVGAGQGWSPCHFQVNGARVRERVATGTIRMGWPRTAQGQPAAALDGDFLLPQDLR